MTTSREVYTLAELWSVFSIPDIRFEYVSYDHKLAEAAQKQRVKSMFNTTTSMYLNSYLIEDDLKETYKIFKIGKLFNISFRMGRLYKIYIGHKRPKSFTIENFGYEVKPIISPFQDRYDLIGRGLALIEKNK